MKLCLRIALCLLLTFCASTQAEADAAWDKLRDAAVNRERRLIFNNDGNEPVYFCKTVSKDELLKVRTTPLAGSQVDSIFYCTWSSGFGLFTHNTKVGQVFNTREAMFSNNMAQACLDGGIDPLTTMVEFGKANDIEIFWSMRMNDTHDGSSAAYGPVMFRANKLKLEHPEYLIGSREKRPKHGAWSAVDYGVAEVRDLAFRYCEEVANNYDVDGIELDFFRHAFLFKTSGAGNPCGETELNQLTGLVRRIRTMMEEVGHKRKRPILLAVRVPDSVEYCKTIGIDLERWLADGLLDLLIVSGYTQLNDWSYSVQLARKHGVKVYPSLDEPRVRDEAANKSRASLATYRGRAMNAWAAGMDGIYMFNYFDPHSVLWRELGDTNVLAKLERHYYASVRGVGSMPVPHHKFINVPTLNPASPVSLTNGPAQVVLRTGEGKSNRKPGKLRVRLADVDSSLKARCVWNDAAVKAGKVDGDWREFNVPARLIQATNVFKLSLVGKIPAKARLADAVLVVE